MKIRKKVLAAVFLTLLTILLSGLREDFYIAIFQTVCYFGTIALVVRSYYEDKYLKLAKVKVRRK